MAKDDSKESDAPTGPSKQYQEPPLHEWRDWPVEDQRVYGKLDCREAFHSIAISERLSQFMCFRANKQIYAYRRLPQGWKYSPLYFTMALGHILGKIQWPAGCRVTHYQDDILLAARDSTTLKTAMAKALKVLQSYGFECRPDKCQGPVTEIDFCGIHFDADRTMRANPGRKEITEAAAKASCQKFLDTEDKNSMLRFIRSWAGVFNYMSNWLTPKMRENQRSLFAAMKDIQQDQVLQEADKLEITETVADMIEYYLNKIPVLWGSIDTAPATFVCTDSNQGSWAAVFLILNQEIGSTFRRQGKCRFGGYHGA